MDMRFMVSQNMKRLMKCALQPFKMMERYFSLFQNIFKVMKSYKQPYYKIQRQFNISRRQLQSIMESQSRCQKKHMIRSRWDTTRKLQSKMVN